MHEIKIDRSFVMGISPGSPDVDIVASTLALAHKRGLRTVAEGVETPAAWSLLRELGCDAAQGYLMARPMPADQLLLAPRRVQPELGKWVDKAYSRS